MNGYTPHSPVTSWVVGIILVGTLLAGLVLSRLPPNWYTRPLAWMLTIGATVGVERLCRDEPAGVRMLAIIGALFFGMKAVVSVEARKDGVPMPSAWRWLGFATLWPGMRPGPFANLRQKSQSGAWPLIGRGWLLASLGLMLAFSAWWVWHDAQPTSSGWTATILATLLLLPGLSLIVHFGVFNILTGLWRLVGVDVRPLFRAPLAARSLETFWSRRWNLAFADMTAIAIYRPLASTLGRDTATVAAFFASGILHELAISVPVMAGFGLPLLYFSLHGVLVLVERGLERSGRPVTGWGWWAHVWVLSWLALPLPILFHLPFLRGVVWPIIGME